MADQRREFRAAVLRAFGASGPVVEELLAFDDVARPPPASAGPFPLPPEPHVETWREYAAEAAEQGAWAVLRSRLPQLRFPIRAGMSQTEAYRAATRRGEIASIPDGEAPALRSPHRLQLWVQDALAGPIPVLCTADRDDFVLLVRALSCRNEPEFVPDSMGACLVSGFNNWDRIRRLRQRCDPAAWPDEFRRIVRRKALYQDRLMILCDGPYSNVPAQALGLSPDEWLRLSRVIRTAHEGAHYLSLRLFGSMLDHPLDELIADYIGVAAACGRCRADWILRFLGLEAFPTYRKGGRLENYRGRPPLSEAAFGVLQGLVHAAAGNLERIDARRFSGPHEGEDRAVLAPLLFQTTLEELASARAGKTHLGGE